MAALDKVHGVEKVVRGEGVNERAWAPDSSFPAIFQRGQRDTAPGNDK
jgi:hypothetical protein